MSILSVTKTKDRAPSFFEDVGVIGMVIIPFITTGIFLGKRIALRHTTTTLLDRKLLKLLRILGYHSVQSSKINKTSLLIIRKKFIRDID